MVKYYLHITALQRAIYNAVKASGIAKRATVHSLRHSFARHLLQCDADIRTIQELLLHKDASTTMIYTYLVQKGAMGVQSALEDL